MICYLLAFFSFFVTRGVGLDLFILIWVCLTFLFRSDQPMAQYLEERLLDQFGQQDEHRAAFPNPV